MTNTIPTGLKIVFGVQCSECDNEINVMGRMNDAASAMRRLRSNMQQSGWEVLRLGALPMGVVCSGCAKALREEHGDADAEDDDETSEETEADDCDTDDEDAPVARIAGR
jgi:hypothetical protein